MQWERWVNEILGHLGMIVGANVIALSCVILQDSSPCRIDQLTRDEKVRLAVPHTGKKYKLDALAVHNIITQNISETSHTYTYIKSKINKNNGQIDIKALRDRYHNPEMKYMFINEAKKTFETLSYRNERAMKFEVFNSKFQNIVNIL